MGDTRKKEMGHEHVAFVSTRKFGIEIELNAFDGKNKPDDGNSKVAGIDYVASVVNANSEEGAEVRGWEHTNNNNTWIVKPDSSCGMEVCTPPFSGWKGVQKVCRVIEALSKDAKIKSDKRCSVHVHIDFSDLENEQIARVLSWYIKCEPVILDAVPDYRKVNRYCQVIGMTNNLSHDEKYSPQEIINRVGDVKYYTMNAKSLKKDSARRTVEFRVIEGDGCKDAYLIKNWIRFLLHFIDRALAQPINPEYKRGDPWSHLCWLDPEDTMRFLGFSDNPKAYELSKGLQQTRDWFLARMMKFMSNDPSRLIASKELQNILRRFKEAGHEIRPEEHLTPKELSWALYDESCKF
jgi:hypothetical protein